MGPGKGRVEQNRKAIGLVGLASPVPPKGRGAELPSACSRHPVHLGNDRLFRDWLERCYAELCPLTIGAELVSGINCPSL